MKIACIGGGPAGLYLGILVKRAAPEHDVVIYERNRPTDTFGFGVVFSDATLGNLAAADPETHAQITQDFARWDDIEIHAGNEVFRSTGHGFCGIERKRLLQILQARAAELGVRVHYERGIGLDELRVLERPDVIVACDGAASTIRDQLAAELAPSVDVRPNKFVWLGCTVPYTAFTFLFKETPHGLFRVHAYRYHERGSTFIVECREDTWRAAGLAETDEDGTVSRLEQIFERELAGHKLVKNRSIWRNFPTVRCGRWHAGDVVLVGDAAHTAHFSIGSGTKLAMEDAIVLRDELLAGRAVPDALAAYEARRRPEVEALQAAAQASLEWFEGTERYLKMAPVQFAYSLMTRSLRVSHQSVLKRDPHLARGVEDLLARAAGVPPTAPTGLPFALGTKRARSRLVVHSAAADAAAAARGLALVPAAPTGADGPTAPGGTDARVGIVTLTATRAQPVSGAQLQQAIDAVHKAGALAAVRLAATDRASIATAAAADADLLVLDPELGGEPVRDGEATPEELLPARIAAARTEWPTGAAIAAIVRDQPKTRAAVIGHAAQLVRAGATLLWVRAAEDASGSGGRVPAAPLADRLRNELGVATVIDAQGVSRADLDAAVAAGRADLVAIGEAR
ncbi:MAG TPA: FAD-dependent monooxygenase [Kofleriaceae bacterium]